jgi:predicted site-specific integrase-resolvase
MALEKVQCLSQWAREIGVYRATLKRWLAADCAIVLPRVPKGSKVLIRERDIETVLRKRTARSDWSLLRGKSARRSGV